MTLADGKIGATYCVDRIDLPLKIKRRLEMLGMTWNSGVSVLNMKKNGAMIIKVRGTRFAIGRRLAEGIYIGGDGR